MSTNLYGTLATQTVDGKTFDAIKITIPFPSKTAYLRLPTSKEMTDYFNKPAKAKKDQTPEQLALQLFNVIRVDQDGVEFDEYEGHSAIDVITRSKALTYERVGDAYKVDVETPFNTTTHTLSIPTQKQISVFRRSATKNYLNAVKELYNELFVKAEGYVEPIVKEEIPPHHKLDAVNLIFNALDALDPILDPNS